VVSHWPGGTKSEVPERINDVCCVGDPDGICSLRAFPLLTQCGHGLTAWAVQSRQRWARSPNDWIDPISAHHQRLIGRDHTLEVVGFHAWDQANVFQCRKLALGFGGLPERQIEFTQVFVGAAVAAIEQ